MIIWNNPEFRRLVRAKLRPRNLVMISLIGALIFGGILAVCIGLHIVEPFRHTLAEAMRTAFYTIVSVQFAVLGLYGLSVSAQSVALERERNTYDFQRLVSMGPWRLAWGKLFGCAAEALCIAAVGSLFALAPVISQAVPLEACLQAELIVVIAGMLSVSIGLMCSTMAVKSSQSTGLVFLFGIGYFIAQGMLGTLSHYGVSIWSASSPFHALGILFESVGKPQNQVSPALFSFHGIMVPMLAGFVVINLCVMALAFVVTVRRLRDDELAFLSPRQAIVTWGIFNFLVLCDLDTRSYFDNLAAFHALNAFALIMMAFALTPGAELFRGRLTRAKKNEHWRVLREWPGHLEDSSSLSVICAAAGGYAVVAAIFAVNHFDAVSILVIPMVASVGIASAALLMYLQVYTDTLGLRAGAGVILLALLVPPLLGTIVKVPDLQSGAASALVSPFAYIFMMDDLPHFHSFRGVGFAWSCPLICMTLAALLVALCAMRIRFLLDMQDITVKREQQTVPPPLSVGNAPA